MKAQKVLGIAVLATCSLVAGAAMADTLSCQQLNGYENGKAGDPPGLIQPAPTNTWSTVRANAQYFYGRKISGDACVVKEVESPKSTAKKAGAPDVGTYTVRGTDKQTAQDECSMLNSVAQIHSKLGNAKAGDAYLINRALMDKAVSLKDTGKLEPSAAKAIYGAAELVDACIFEMLPQ